MSQQLKTEPAPQPDSTRTAGQYLNGVKTVVAMEMRQRLRSRGWYILLAVWFVVIGLVALLSWRVTASTESTGPVLFDLMVGFVLFFGLLVAPALSANAVNGDRSSGTLAIMQITLLTPGQILLGKLVASWLASLGFLVASIPFIVAALAFGGVSFSVAAVSVIMLAVELGLVCAIGVGISALTNRPLFSIVTSYMVVAALSIGTLISFGLSMPLVEEEVDAPYLDYGNSFESMPEPTCSEDTMPRSIYHSDRTAWILSLNPFVVLADAVPYAELDSPNNMYVPQGVMHSISDGVRYLQAGPEHTEPCLNGEVEPAPPQDLAPLWPLGLGLQLFLAAALMLLGRRRLLTPAKRLSRGTRIA